MKKILFFILTWGLLINQPIHTFIDMNDAPSLAVGLLAGCLHYPLTKGYFSINSTHSTWAVPAFLALSIVPGIIAQKATKNPHVTQDGKSMAFALTWISCTLFSTIFAFAAASDQAKIPRILAASATAISALIGGYLGLPE